MIVTLTLQQRIVTPLARAGKKVQGTGGTPGAVHYPL